jgi:hypothetical protein
MKTNPDYYRDLLGKKFIIAYLCLNKRENVRVNSLKDARLKIIRRQITKIKVYDRKKDWKEVAYFDLPNRFLNNTITAYKKGGLRDIIENPNCGNGRAEYDYFEDQRDYFAGDVATYEAIDIGQNDEEIRKALEDVVKNVFDYEAQELARKIEVLKKKEEYLKTFAN